MKQRLLSTEINEQFEVALAVLSKIRDSFFEEEKSSYAIFDAIRIYMVAAAVFLERNEMKGTDENLRAVLHNMLKLAIDDFQFNERLHVGSKEGS